MYYTVSLTLVKDLTRIIISFSLLWPLQHCAAHRTPQLSGDERQSYHCTICNDPASMVGQSFNSTLDSLLFWLPFGVTKQRSFPTRSTLARPAIYCLLLPLLIPPPVELELSLPVLTLSFHHQCLFWPLGQVFKQLWLLAHQHVLKRYAHHSRHWVIQLRIGGSTRARSSGFLPFKQRGEVFKSSNLWVKLSMMMFISLFFVSSG